MTEPLVTADAPKELRIGPRQLLVLSQLAGQRVAAEATTLDYRGPRWTVVRTKQRLPCRLMKGLIERKLLHETRDCGRWREWKLTDEGERAAVAPPPSPRKRKVRAKPPQTETAA